MRVPLKEKAYDYILEQIMNGELDANTPISENEYCERLSISRTPLREALKQLETEGLIYKIPERGAFLKAITLTDIEEICQLRKLFELEALKYSINKITQEDLQECKKMLEELNSEPDAQAFFRADKSFHKLILKYCPNKRLIDYYRNLEKQIERFQRLLGERKDHYKEVQCQHMELLNVLRTKDYEATAMLLSNHLDDVYRNIIEIYNAHRLFMSDT